MKSISTLLVIASLVGGCASSNGPVTAEKPMEENAVVHTSSAGELATLESKQAVKSDRVVLWVNGLGCPQCASNVDIQLGRLSGVANVATDLSSGKITVALTGSLRPSPAQFKAAIEDAGFTLVKIEDARV